MEILKAGVLPVDRTYVQVCPNCGAKYSFEGAEATFLQKHQAVMDGMGCTTVEPTGKIAVVESQCPTAGCNTRNLMEWEEAKVSWFKAAWGDPPSHKDLMDHTLKSSISDTKDKP